MPPTPLTKTTRFVPQGTSRYYWLPTVAAADYIPTRIEIDGGTDLTGEVAAITGFTTTVAQVDTPDAETRFISRVPASITPDDSSITFYGSKDSEDAGSFFSRDQEGFLVFADGGDVATQNAEVVPVTVANVSRTREITGASTVIVSYSITDEPVTFELPAIA